MESILVQSEARIIEPRTVGRSAVVYQPKDVIFLTAGFLPVTSGKRALATL